MSRMVPDPIDTSPLWGGEVSFADEVDAFGVGVSRLRKRNLKHFKKFLSPLGWTAVPGGWINASRYN